MKEPDYWKCPSCGNINPLSRSKCRCGESKDNVRKYIQAKTNSGTYGGVLSVILAIATIVLLYAWLTTIIGDYCVAKRMAYPGQYKMYGPGQYEGSSGLTGYRLVIDIICYIALPLFLLAWAHEIKQEHESISVTLISYAAIMIVSYLVMRFYTLPRLLIAVGIWLVIMAITSRHRMKKYKESYHPSNNQYEHEDNPYEHEENSYEYEEKEPEPTIEDKLLKYVVFTELAKEVTGHDNMFDQMDEEAQEDPYWLSGEPEDPNWLGEDIDDDDDNGFF